MLKPHLFKLSLNVSLIPTNSLSLSQLWFCCLQLSVARLMQTAVLQIGVCRNAVVCIIMSNTSVWSTCSSVNICTTITTVDQPHVCEAKYLVQLPVNYYAMTPTT